MSYSYTAQGVLDLARESLHDSAKVRFPDAELLTYLNGAVNTIRLKRPDLFVGQWLALPAQVQLTDLTIPIKDEYVQAIAFYIVFRAEAKDDEFVDNSRALAFKAEFDKVFQ